MPLYNQILNIETPFGPIQADLDDIKDAITHVSQGLHLQENAFYGSSKLPKLALLLQSARNIVLNA